MNYEEFFISITSFLQSLFTLSIGIESYFRYPAYETWY